jgi:hypothetical protein
MSRFLRKARALLGSCPDFPKVEISVATYSETDHKLLRLPRADVAVSGDPLAIAPRGEEVDLESPLHASITSMFAQVEEKNLTGTMDFRLYFFEGRVVMNSGFCRLCHGDDAPLNEAISHFAGRGLAESLQLKTEDETRLHKLEAYSGIWVAALLNLIPISGWENPDVEVFDEPLRRFRVHRCNDAMQATWDALTSLLLLEKALPPSARDKHSRQVPPVTALTQRETNILEAIGADELTGQQLAEKAGYPFTGRFRATLSEMKKRRLLVAGHLGRGYRRGTVS